MGLLDRIFGNGKEREASAGGPATSLFHESESGADDSEPSRNAPRRELVQVILRDTMRKHGIPSDWIDCRILSTVNRQGRPGLHVNFVVRQAHDRLLAYVFAFQESFERELARFEPRSREWLLSLGWEFTGFDADQMPDPKSWGQSAPAPLVPAGAAVATADRAFVPTADEDEPKTDEDVQRDLKALFAIRDAALDEAAGRKKRRSDPEPPDFEPTQPFDDGPRPKA